MRRLAKAAHTSERQKRHLRVRGGYLPPEVHVTAGLPTRLVFLREETAGCSEQLVFPDLGISITLPPFRAVAIDLPTSEPGEHRFGCQMDMLHGRLIVDPASPVSTATRRGRRDRRVRPPHSSFPPGTRPDP